MDEEEAALRAKLDEETSYEERRKIRAALRELRKRKVQELAKPLSETLSSSTLLSTHQNDTPRDTSSVSGSGSHDLSVFTNGDDTRHDEDTSVISSLNLDEITDEDEIQRLIESTPLTAYNDRKRLRARLRQLKKERSEKARYGDETTGSVSEDNVKQDLLVESIENGTEILSTGLEDEVKLSEAEMKAKIAAEKAEQAKATKAKAKAALQAKREAEERARLEEEERRREEEKIELENKNIVKEKEERARQEAQKARKEQEEKQREIELRQNQSMEKAREDEQREEEEKFEGKSKEEFENNENEDESNEMEENGEYYNEWDYDEYSKVYEEELPDSESVSSRGSESSSLSAQNLLRPRHPTSAFKREKIKTVSEHEKEAKDAMKKLRRTEQSERLMGFKGAPAIKTDVKETYDFKANLRKQGIEPVGLLKKKQKQEKEVIDFKQHLRKTGEDLTRKKAGVKKDPQINTLDLRDSLKTTETAGDLYKSAIRKTPKVEKEKPQKYQLRETGQTLPGQKITMEKYLKSKEKSTETTPASPKTQLKETGIHLPGRKLSVEEGQEGKKPFKKITSAELLACIAQSDPGVAQKSDFMKQRGMEKPASQYGPVKKLIPSLSFEEQQKDYERVVSGGSVAGRLDVKDIVAIKARQMEKLKETEVKPEFRSVLKKSEGPRKPKDGEIPEEALEWINKPKPLQKKVTEQNVDDVYKRNIDKPKDKPEWQVEKEDYYLSKSRREEMRKLEERREAKKQAVKSESQQIEYTREISPKPGYIPNYNIIKSFQVSSELAAPSADQKQLSIRPDPKADLHKFRNELLKAAQAKEARGSAGEATTGPEEMKVVWSEQTPAPAAKENTVV